MPGNAGERRRTRSDLRLVHIALALCLAFTVLGARLWELQVHEGAEYRGKSESNRLRIQRLESPRGVVYARHADDLDVVLADNRPARDLMVVPADITIDDDELCRRLEEIVGIDGDGLLATIQKARKAREPFKQLLIRADVPTAVSARVDEYGALLPGVFTVVRPIRRYVYGETAGQILGYLGEVNTKELREKDSDYQMGDLIGRAGVESLYEDELHGKDGRMLVTKFAAGTPQIRTDPYGKPYVENLVDSYGHSLRVEEEIRQPVPGKSVHLTLDIGLQAKAEALLEGETGAIVALNADTGAVLALASSPGYDPTVFVTRSGNRERLDILRGKPNRMMHRAYQEVYPPGSVFKVLLAAAALEEGVIDADTTHYCPGKFRITPNGRAWHCWNRSGHGDVNVVDALAFSCDVFFYHVGLELGVDRITKWAHKLGLGEQTGLDLPGEVSGLIPSRDWKENRLRPQHPNEPWEYRWYPGDTVNLAIGQGAAATTPLQNALLISAIVNGGYRVQPHVNRETPAAKSQRLLSDRTIGLIRAGLTKCVEKGPPAPTGTGHEAYMEGWHILGKTGSAQNVSLAHQEDYENEEDIPKELRDHAWFVAGVLDREPPLAICVLVEHGHHGGAAAAPLARDLIAYFYDEWAPVEMRLARNRGEPQ